MKSALLVDDSKTMLMSLTAVLKKAGYSVDTAGDGSEALTKVKAGAKHSVIITDLNMPKMDGITFIREARKAGARFTPILMLTTESQETKRAEARAAGATGWLVKPVQPDDLVKVLGQVVAGG
jgi:two-component system, chemotaxis family, chemotaxis protein CheY